MEQPQYKRQEGAAGVSLVAPSFLGLFDERWYDPAFWQDGASAVTRGGRGAAWFIRAGSDQLVLRHFCRGGIPGRFIRRHYLFTGEDHVRSFSEFRLLDQLFRRGFPVPEPVAAGYQKEKLGTYQAALIMRCIPGAIPLAECAQPGDHKTWQAAGQCVRRFHDAGVFHADLNCMNVLVSDEIYLIDFDRGRLMPSSSDDRWKRANLSRFERSVHKCLGAVGTEPRDGLWQAFLTGYGARPQ